MEGSLPRSRGSFHVKHCCRSTYWSRLAPFLAGPSSFDFSTGLGYTGAMSGQTIHSEGEP